MYIEKRMWVSTILYNFGEVSDSCVLVLLPIPAMQVYVSIPVDSAPYKFTVKASVSSPLIDVVCSALPETVFMG